MASGREARSTRGKRMSALIGEELEADETFWNQEALADEADDDDFDAEGSEPEDEIDSDFDKPEEVVEEVVVEVRERRARPSSRAYKDKRASAKGPQGISKPNRAPSRGQAARSAEAADASLKERATLRRTTKLATEVTLRKKHERDRETEQRRRKIAERDLRRPETREMTQEELMAEALKTEEVNRKSYLELVRLEEERKREPTPTRAPNRGERVVFRSAKGKQTLSFTASTLPAGYVDRGGAGDSSDCSDRAPVCAVTGRPARYRDPLTGSYFADVAAFKVLRERHASAQSIELSAADGKDPEVEPKHEHEHEPEREATEAEPPDPKPGASGDSEVTVAP